MISIKEWMKVGVIIACIAGIVTIVFILLPSLFGFVSYISIERLQFPPPCYFNLTEEDLNRYPVLRELLNEMGEKNLTYHHKELGSSERGVEIYKYLLNRVEQETGGCEGIFFAYKGQCYRVRVALT